MTAAESPRDLLAALQASITRASEIPATVTADAHALIRDGAAHFLMPKDADLYDQQARRGPGRALCSCRWLSEPLPAPEARRQAHAQHVTGQTS